MARNIKTMLPDDSMTTAATKAELSALSRHALSVFEQPVPNLHNYDEVRAAISQYFITCDNNGIRPANLGLYASLGLTKRDVDEALSGRTSKISPDCVALLRKAKLALSTYREGLAMTGKLNPVTAIFWAKNFDSMSDTQQIEVVANRTDHLQLTQEEINKRIPLFNDIEQDRDSTD